MSYYSDACINPAWTSPPCNEFLELLLCLLDHCPAVQLCCEIKQGFYFQDVPILREMLDDNLNILLFNTTKYPYINDRTIDVFDTFINLCEEYFTLCRDNPLILFTEKEMMNLLKIIEESEKSQNERITVSQSYFSKLNKSIEQVYVAGKIDQGMEYHKVYHKLMLIYAQLQYISQIPTKTKPQVLSKDENSDYDKENENFHLNIKVYSCQIHYNDSTNTLIKRSASDTIMAPVDNLKDRVNKDVNNNTLDEDAEKPSDTVAEIGRWNMNKGIFKCEAAVKLVNNKGRLYVLNIPPFRTSVFRQRQYVSQKKRGTVADKEIIVISSSDSETNACTESITAITATTNNRLSQYNQFLTENPADDNSSTEDTNHNTSSSTSNIRIPVLPIFSGDTISTPKATFDKFKRKHTTTISRSVQNNTKQTSKNNPNNPNNQLINHS